MAFGDKPLSLKLVSVAALTSGSYGTATEVGNETKMTIKPNLISSKLAGRQGRTAAVATFAQDADVVITAGGLPWDALAVMLPITVTESGTTPNQIKKTKLGAGSNFPYFGAVGVTFDDDGGDTHFAFPKLKVTEMPEWELDGEGNAFLSGEITAVAACDDNGYIMYPVSHETAAAVNFSTIFS